jgi:endonuclease/exonuclease/phosphatase family metal-dependent hydrolase
MKKSKKSRRVKGIIAIAAFLAAIAVGYFQRENISSIADNFHTNEPGTQLEDTVSIATFNTWIFGQSKLSKPDIMEKMVDIIGRYDVIAIQEIRSKEQNVMPTLVDMLNRSGKQYDYVISKRMGRSSQKEQYAFVYNTRNISYINDSAFIIDDAADKLHREPFVASFKVNNGSFDFTLINIHTDPDIVKQEMNVLDDVYRAVQESDSEENDVILLGDLNTPGRRLYELGRIPGIYAIIADKKTMTNTRNNEQFDNIVFDGNTETEFTGQYEVFSYENEYGMTIKEALRISDHRPVSAKFTRNGSD